VKVDPRIARGGVLAAWAAFFCVLWLTGASARYLGERTQWVVPFGAIGLALVALAYGAVAVRSGRSAGALTLREATSLLCLLVPLAAVLVAPNAALGSFAAGRKSGDVFLHARPPVPASPSDASFLDIRVADGDEVYALQAGIAPGLRVKLLGIATGSRDVPVGTFELARFYISCCIADAQAVGVPVDPGALARRSYAPDTWLEVTGTLKRREGRYVVVADAIRPAEQPRKPYLAFRF
jgi:uncharacterized repeat protein (TIGR03943 family)